MTVIIKRIGSDTIALRECEEPTLYWVSSLCIGAVVAATGMTCSTIINPIPAGVGAGIGVFGFVIMLLSIPLSDIRQPAYRIYSYSVGGTDHIIVKTTPEADQIAICKAAKEIEAELIEIQTREARLEEMARKCK